MIFLKVNFLRHRLKSSKEVERKPLFQPSTTRFGFVNACFDQTTARALSNFFAIGNNKLFSSIVQLSDPLGLKLPL